MDKWAPPLLGLHMPGHIGPFAHTKIFFSGKGGGGRGRSKIKKYSELLHKHSFAPVMVVVETLGVWGAEVEKLLEELGPPISKARSKSFLRQK